MKPRSSEPIQEQPYPGIYTGDIEAEAELDSVILCDSDVSRATLAGIFINMRSEIGEVSSKKDKMYNLAFELDRLISFLFRKSEAYAVALELYRNRYNITKGKLAEQLLQDLLDNCTEERMQSHIQEVKADVKS